MRLKQIGVLLFFTTVSLCQSPSTNPVMTHEEEVVRTTYARLAFATQINEIHNRLREGHRQGGEVDPIDFKIRMQSNTLSFELSNFKIGPLSEIAETKYSDLVTKPSRLSGDSLEVSPGTFTFNHDGIPSESAIAMARWIPSNDITENWDIPFAKGYAQGEWAGQHQRYASFNVKVTFQGRSCEYRAMFLFGTGANSQELVSPLDTIININGNSLTHFVRNDAYPETLIEGGLGNDPAIHEWLAKNQVPRGHQGSANCDPVTLHCGIHSDDLKKLVPTVSPIQYKKINENVPQLVEAGFHPRQRFQALLLQDTANCSNFNNITGLLPSVIGDNTFHISGSHILTTARTTSCIYSNGNNTNGNCNTECDVDLSPSWSETGTTTSSCHQIGKNVKAGFATATAQGVSCSGVAGGGVKACTLCQCNVSVSILGLSVSSDGFFTAQVQGDNSCGAQVQNPPPPPPGCSPPPPDEQFTNNNPADSPDCEPLIMDLAGKGFHLTNTANGAVFDIRADGRPLRIPWTADSTNAFLVLDRNGNGVIDNGSELFGNVTPQPAGSTRPNGFLALAEYDKPENGGNGDGVIDSRDAIFSQLRLWVDANHDGISQPEELHTLQEMGVLSISLDYSLSRRTDEFGNVFRYKAKINQGVSNEPGVGRNIYDVFFVTK